MITLHSNSGPRFHRAPGRWRAGQQSGRKWWILPRIPTLRFRCRVVISGVLPMLSSIKGRAAHSTIHISKMVLHRAVTSHYWLASDPPPTSDGVFGVYCVLRMLAHRLPNHISKTVPPTVHSGPP